MVSAVIRGMLEAERFIHDDLSGAVCFALPFFPGYTRGELTAAARLQPPCVDLRPLVPVVFDRWPSLQALGLAPPGAPLPTAAVQLDLLTSALDVHHPSPTSQGARHA